MKKTKGLIAAAHSETAEAAATIFREGGNAFDAAIAAFLASFVAEPCMSSAGGGAFMTAYKNDGTALIYDYFVQTPKRKRPAEDTEFFPVELDFGTTKEVFHIGMGAAGVPGSIAGVFKVYNQLASLPMSVLAEPAIRLAKEGVLIDPFQEHDFDLLEPILRVCHPSPVFWVGDRLIRVGERMYMPEFADCLENLAREGVDLFYKGDIAKQILKLNADKGGHLTREDLETYEVHKQHPLHFRYRDRQILTNPLPSIGGSTLAIMMAKLEAKGPINEKPTSREHTERLIDVCSRIDAIKKTPKALAEYLAKWYPHMSDEFDHEATKIGGTSHFSVLDEYGNAAAVTTSNGEGCGHFIPSTGILLNNMLGELALLPHGIHSWEENVRLGSMMSPTIVLDPNEHAEIVIGSAGAGRIPSMIGQVIHYLVDYNMSLEEAVNAPRLHWTEGTCNLEPGLHNDVAVPESLKALVPWEKQSLYFGGVNAILYRDQTYYAEGDSRRGGVTVRVR